MPSAQGRMTVRRRPNDGNNGADAVDYKFIPSAYSIVLQKDGTLRPSALSCRLVKKVGGAPEVDMIASSFDGHTVRSTVRKSNGYITNAYTPGTSLTLSCSSSATLLSVDFELVYSGKVVASITIPCIPAGIDGEDSYVLDLDNEMQGIPCNSSGTPTITGTLAETTATVYKGSKVDTGWEFSISTDSSGCTASIDKTTGKVTVTAISADKASVIVVAKKGSLTREAVMSLYKVKAGGTGTSAVVYSIEVSDSAISKDQYGTLNPTSITAYKIKTVGSSRAKTAEMVLKYQRVGQDTAETTLSGQGGEIKDFSDDCTAVVVTLYAANGTTVLDKERIPVVKDGSDGKPGEDAYVLDLDNEVQGIPCNSSGTPTISGTLATSIATVYKGSKVDTGWEFSISTDSSGCTASIDKSTGKVTVTAISADKASVIVVATKGSLTREAVMSLYKVKAGGTGTSAVVYSIDSNVSVLRRDTNGNLDPSSFTAYKLKTVGNTTSRTTERTLKYKRNGQDSSETTLSGEGGEIKDISSACTSISLTLYNGTTVLDSETIPILKDGEKGDPSVRYWLVPSVTEVSKNSAGTLTPSTVSCQVMKQVGDNPAEATTDLFALYKITQTNGVTGRGTSYTPGSALTVAATTKQIVFELYKIGSVTAGIASGTGAALDTVTISVVADGAPGGQGIQGKQGIQGCVYRRSKFATGFEYHNDEALTTDGIRYIDLVYIMKDSTVFASHALWFKCKKTHTSNTTNAPEKDDTNRTKWDEYWEPINTLEPVYTPLLLADDAVITLMQSNQILIANDEGVITAGMSGSLAGSKIRIWAGASTPDSAPFRVDVAGKLFSSNAEIAGKITATTGKIAGFNISGNALTNGPEFDNDACVIFRNDANKTFAGIGGNVLPATSGNKAVARFENEDQNNFWGLGRNIAMLLSAKNGDINHAFLGSGNGNLDGWIGGYHFSRFQLNAANTVYNGYLKISENNMWVVYAVASNSAVTLPKLTDVRNALGIGTSTNFCIEFLIIADVFSQQDFKVYGRTKLEINNATPYFSGEYPTIVNANGARVDSITMGKGDSLRVLLIYEAGRSGTLDTDYTIMYTARIINQQY